MKSQEAQNLSPKHGAGLVEQFLLRTSQKTCWERQLGSMCITERADHQWLVTEEEIWDEKDTNEQDLNAFIFPTFVHGQSWQMLSTHKLVHWSRRHRAWWMERKAVVAAELAVLILGLHLWTPEWSSSNMQQNMIPDKEGQTILHL